MVTSCRRSKIPKKRPPFCSLRGTEIEIEDRGRGAIIPAGADLNFLLKVPTLLKAWGIRGPISI